MNGPLFFITSASFSPPQKQMYVSKHLHGRVFIALYHFSASCITQSFLEFFSVQKGVPSSEILLNSDLSQDSRV